MKYIEAKREIEGLSSKYCAYEDKHTNFFNINYKNVEVAYLESDVRYSICVWSQEHFSKLPFSNRLYMILSELAMTPIDERKEDKKYRVNAFGGVLNINIFGAAMFLPEDKLKTKFTYKEIEQLKQRDDIPLNWDKVELEEVK